VIIGNFYKMHKDSGACFFVTSRNKDGSCNGHWVFMGDEKTPWAMSDDETTVFINGLWLDITSEVFGRTKNG
jgi:hypothetical protein